MSHAPTIAISEAGPRFDGRVMISGELAATFYSFDNGDPQHSNEVPVPDAVVDEYGPITYLCSVEVAAPRAAYGRKGFIPA